MERAIRTEPGSMKVYGFFFCENKVSRTLLVRGRVYRTGCIRIFRMKDMESNKSGHGCIEYVEQVELEWERIGERLDNLLSKIDSRDTIQSNWKKR